MPAPRPGAWLPADSLDVEADRLEQIGQAEVNFEAPPTLNPDDLEPAVQADFVVVGSLSLMSDRLEWAHEIGVRGGVQDCNTEDEALRVMTDGIFASAEVTCDRVDAGEHCATAADLVAGNLDMVRDRGAQGILTVHREDGVAAPDGSGVRAVTARMQTPFF